MKALSIRQPWAWLICAGIKDIENRRRHTKFRGRVYVHTGKVIEIKAFELLAEMYLMDKRGIIRIGKDVISRIIEYGLPNRGMFATGAIIGEVDITDCVWSQNEGLSATKSPWFTGPYGWVLANPVVYDKAIPCKGRQGFFDPKMEIPDVRA